MPDAHPAIPAHIGFIMDGNRRWAKAHGRKLMDGHMVGYKTFKEVAGACFEQGVRYISTYVFSTENWKRDAGEVSYLITLLAMAISKETGWAVKHGIRLRFLGRRDVVDKATLKAMEKAEAATAHLTNGTIAVCLDYGGQQEIADAARACVAAGLKPEEITPDAIAERLYCPDIPPVDLIVRTSGEQRLSNFMLWRAAYSEFLFLEKYWPDMTKDDVTAIIETYGQRARRFGG